MKSNDRKKYTYMKELYFVIILIVKELCLSSLGVIYV